MRELLRAKSNQTLTPEQEHVLKYVSDVGTSVSYTSNIGNIIATRISALWNFVGPSFTVTQGANSVYRCLEIAQGMLARGEVDAAVVAGVDLAASAENMYLKAKCSSNSGGLSPDAAPRASFESTAEGFFAGEGCGAIVLTRLADVDESKLAAAGSTATAPTETGQCRIYASIDAVAGAGNSRTAGTIALARAGRSASDVAYLEVSGDSAATDRVELADLARLYASEDATTSTPTVAVGTVKATVGHVGHASGAAALIKTALSLYNRYLPVLPRWNAPKAELRDGAHAPFGERSPFYVCPESRAWVGNVSRDRVAFVSGVGSSAPGSCFGVVLSDVAGHHETHNLLSRAVDTPKVLVVESDSGASLLAAVAGALARASQSDGAARQEYVNLLRATLEGQNSDDNQARAQEQKMVLALVASPSTLAPELQSAVRGLSSCERSGWAKGWSSPAGSCFAPRRIANAHKVAFMYGDGASPYVVSCFARRWRMVG